VKSAVVIVNWNSGGRLASCLQSLPAGLETVVVDNASATIPCDPQRHRRAATSLKTLPTEGLRRGQPNFSDVGTVCALLNPVFA
jgi:hypothetical protein